MMKKKQFYLFLFFEIFFCLSSGNLFAENRMDVSGLIIDSNTADPIDGVNVVLKDGTKSTISTSDGHYVLTDVAEGSVIVFSHVSYFLKELILGKERIVNVELTSKNITLEEHVVVGYGAVQKKDLTGSISSVNVESLNKAPVASFDQAFAGRVAGLQVNSADGQPGDGVSVVIRGYNSLTGSNSPLYIIDGFPTEDSNNNMINPSDIEKIEILKDASATAIYGARAANGVVIINTKRGKEGAPTISIDSFCGTSFDNGKKIKMMGPYDFVKLQNEINPTRTNVMYFAGERTIDDYREINGYDWYKTILKPAFFYSSNIGLRGGSKDKRYPTRYALSVSSLDQKGVVVNSGFKRIQTRITIDQNITPKIKFGLNMSHSYTRRDGIKPREQTAKGVGSGNSQTNNLFYAAWAYRPVAGPSMGEASLLDEPIDPEVGDYLFNPVISAKNQKDTDHSNRTFINASIDYQISKDLKLKVRGSSNLFRNRREIFYNTNTSAGSPYTSVGRTNGVSGSINQRELNGLLNENSLTYDKKFNKNHKLNVVGVTSFQKSSFRVIGFSANNIPNEELGVSGIDEGTVIKKTSNTSGWGLVSFTTRANYNLYERYLLTITQRADGSSKFSKENRWGYFPSAAIAWRIIDEKFMKGQKFMSNAKIRMSYGLTGNNRVGDYAYLSQMYLGTYYPFNNSAEAAFFQRILGNSKLKWETTKQLDIGVELGFLKNRIKIEADYYRKQTYDLLLNASVAPSTGFYNLQINAGKTQNEGFELTLNTVNISTREIKWQTNVNISINKNQLLSLTQGEKKRFSSVGGFSGLWGNPAYISKVGAPLSLFYGYVYDGVYQYEDFEKLPNGKFLLKHDRPKPGGLVGTVERQPGDIKYKDINGDGRIDDADQTIIGNPYPHHVGGLENEFSYKNFDFQILFQWSYGNQVLNANKVFLEGASGVMMSRNMLDSYANRWTPENQETTIPRLNSSGSVGVWSSRFIEDASYLRLKTISIGYRFKKSLTSRLRLKTARVFVSAQNLYTWSKYSGPDPEVSVKGFGVTPAFDFSAYPLTTSIVFGVNLSL